MKILIGTILIYSGFASAMSFHDFDFISGLLHAGRMDSKMDCTLKVREIKEERKFIDGTKLVDYLKIDFTTAHLGPRSTNITIPKDADIQTRSVVSREWGEVEEIKIPIEDSLSSYVLFQHTGDRIVYFEIIDERSIFVCGVKL
jgi:hypothetical protein